MKIDLINIPTPAKFAITAIPAILICVAIYFLIFDPNNKEINTLTADILKQKDEISKKQKDVKELPIRTKQYDEVLKRFDEIKYQLPMENEVSNLLKQVSDNATINNVPILSWNPGSDKKRNTAGMDYLERPVDITLNGSYHNLGRFFASLTALDRIVNIQNIRLGNPTIKEKEATLNISFSAVTFSSVAAEPKAEAKPAAKTQ
ncbi:MAG: type 4a pilus biogenesis protein PilO [Nitrospirae bacterium]|nr:type 4a pilus biogenesis protein PilO [Nitrospirota bacterium]MBF0542318.1 type 4a pilus biogenesis protein PilO [Nitrospirota bacterium]